MEDCTFYFLKNEYFKDFPNKGLLENKEPTKEAHHGRPYYYVFKDKNSDIYWMIPISSKVNKYQKIYDEKISKYGKCDNIVFGDVSYKKRVFLIQNMCPATSKYIKDQYMISNKPVTISKHLQKELYIKANRILNLVETRGMNLIFPNVKKIKQELIRQLEQEKEIAMQNIQKSKPRKQKIVMKFPNRDNNNRGMGR